MNSVDRSTTPAWVYVLLACIATAGFLYINLMSALVDGLITGWGFSNAQAGVVASTNIYGASFGALLATLLVRRVRWRPSLALLLSMVLLLDLASTLVRTPMPLTLLRGVHGVIAGMAVGVSYAVMARTRSPDRAFGTLLLVQFGLAGLGLMQLPPLVPQFGASLLFFVFAGFTALALLMLPLLPRFEAPQADAGAGPARLSSIARTTATLALLALFLFQAGNMALSAFIIGIGERFGLARDFISQTLGWATWIGALGAVLVIAIGTPRSRLKLLAPAFFVILIGTAAFYRSDVQAVFFTANSGTAIVWSFVVPLLFGILSKIDASGRLATLAGFVSKMGLATGPLLAGWVLRGGGDHALITVSILILVLSGVAALAAAFRIDRKDLSP